MHAGPARNTFRCQEGVRRKARRNLAGEAAPFDAILVTAAPPTVPQPLLEQLAEGGRLIVPVGRSVQELVVYTKTSKGIERKSIFPVRFVPMTGMIQKSH
ncbi:MAG: hypothetical protein COC10_03445 [Sphingobium sp.]|nr:MAG: hypothetical protein COC10_03445 [Sphingobium sp.]